MDILALLSPLSLGVVSGLGLVFMCKLVVSPVKIIFSGVFKQS